MNTSIFVSSGKTNNEQGTKNSVSQKSPTQPQRLTQPKIIVFDSFDNDTTVFDYNNDGIRDRSHGYVVSDIIESQTGYSTQHINDSQFDIETTLKQLSES